MGTQNLRWERSYGKWVARLMCKLFFCILRHRGTSQLSSTCNRGVSWARGPANLQVVAISLAVPTPTGWGLGKEQTAFLDSQPESKTLPLTGLQWSPSARLKTLNPTTIATWPTPPAFRVCHAADSHFPSWKALPCKVRPACRLWPGSRHVASGPAENWGQCQAS